MSFYIEASCRHDRAVSLLVKIVVQGLTASNILDGRHDPARAEGRGRDTAFFQRVARIRAR